MQTTYNTPARRRLSACVAAIILCASGSAGAAETLTFDESGNAFFQIIHAETGSYTDSFVFSVADALVSPAGIAVVGKTRIDKTRMANYRITDITFFSDVGGVRTNLATTFETDAGTSLFYGPDLVAGNYGFTVTGYTLLDGKGGSFAGNLSLMAAVPEPATYAMLGLGLGMVAFAARRKADNKPG